MAAGLLGVVAVLAVACGWLARQLLAARRALEGADHRVRAADDAARAAELDAAAAHDRVAQLETGLSAVTAERDGMVGERDELQQAHARLNAAQERLERELAQARAAHAAAVEALAAERERATAAQQAAAEAAARTADYRALLSSVDASASAVATGAPGATWSILLATLSRRWAAAVGALPEARGAPTGTVPEQFVEALRRESERLREEVGVDVEVRSDDALDPADPVTLLLAATDVLGVLAAMCERVDVHIDGDLVISGDGWTGPTDELEVARERAAASGVAADELAVDGARVAVTLRARAAATT